MIHRNLRLKHIDRTFLKCFTFLLTPFLSFIDEYLTLIATPKSFSRLCLYFVYLSTHIYINYTNCLFLYPFTEQLPRISSIKLICMGFEQLELSTLKVKYGLEDESLLIFLYISLGRPIHKSSQIDIRRFYDS